MYIANLIVLLRRELWEIGPVIEFRVQGTGFTGSFAVEGTLYPCACSEQI